MKKLLILIASVAFIAASCNTTGPSASVHYPEPTGFVVDEADVITEATQIRLEKVLSDFERDTGNELAVVTVKSLGGLDIDSYSIHLAELWKVGKRGSDNGVIFLIAVEDRKVKIEVGRGLEAVITDAKAGQILDKSVVPNFKVGSWEEGILNGVEDIAIAIDPESMKIK